MWKKILTISLCISVLFVFSAPISSVNAKDREIQVNWEIVGTIVGLMPLVSPLFGSPVGVHSLLNLSAKGPPGPAKITVLSRFEGPSSTYSCPSEDYEDNWVFFDKNDGVAVFPDQSLLFVSINPDNTDGGILCFDYGVGTYFKVKLNINGGTGFYDGASGVLEAEGYGHHVSSDGTLSAVTGTITGEIEFSD